MSTSDPLEDLAQTNARLREQITALSARLCEVLNTPADSFALAKARYILAKIENMNRKSTAYRE